MNATRLLVIVAVSMLLAPSITAASPCLGASPFADVPAGESYCSNTEWLKNRGVTLGCAASLYCPNDPVNRAAMALFLNRLSIALTPSTNVTSDNIGVVDLDVATFHCVSPAFAITDFPRAMLLIGHFSGLANAAASYAVSIWYNTDGSVTDFPLVGNPNFERTGSTGSSWTHASTSTSISLDVGSTYRFALQTIRQIGSGDLTAARCNLLQMLQSRERNSIIPDK
jgi:hypothetical protein